MDVARGKKCASQKFDLKAAGHKEKVKVKDSLSTTLALSRAKPCR